MQDARATKDSTATTPCFAEVEAKVNEILHREWQTLISDPAEQARYAALFDRSVEEGFYVDPSRRNHTLPPSGARPNEAYIQSHEAMWEPVDEYLESMELRIDRSFRELFSSSHEFEDTEMEHRRVFFGVLCAAQGRPLTAFMLTVPHSHECFRFSTPMHISISTSSV